VKLKDLWCRHWLNKQLCYTDPMSTNNVVETTCVSINLCKSMAWTRSNKKRLVQSLYVNLHHCLCKIITTRTENKKNVTGFSFAFYTNTTTTYIKKQEQLTSNNGEPRKPQYLSRLVVTLALRVYWITGFK